MSRKILTFLTVIFLLTVPAVSQEVYSGTLTESEQRIQVNGEVIKDFSAGFTGEKLSVEISRINETVENLQIYRAYSLETSGYGEVYSLNLTVDIENWINSTNLDDYETRLMMGEELYTSILRQKEEHFYANMPRPSPPTTFYIGGSDNIHDRAQLAVNPGRTICGFYLRPGPDFEKVDTCKNKLGTGSKTADSSESPLNQIKIEGKVLKVLGISAAVIISASVVIILFREYMNRGDAGEIAEITEQLINKMESGEIERDERVLEKLEKANELAYDGSYSEANRLLEEVKRDIRY